MKSKFTRAIALILSLMLLFVLAGCSKEESGRKDRDKDDDDGKTDISQILNPDKDQDESAEPEASTEPEPVYEKQTVYLCVREYLQNNEGGDFLKGYTYDEYGRVTEYYLINEDGSRGWVNEYSYDEDGNNTEIRTGSSVTVMSYDENGRMTSKLYYYKDECTTETYYEYDALGHPTLETRIERYDEEITYTYELFYNEDYTEAMINQYKNGEPNGTTYETYNAAGQVLKSEVYDAEGNWKSTLTYEYDGAGKLLREGSYTRSETQADYMTIYTYDDMGLLISKNVDYYYGYLLEYTYEPFEILVRVN